jgi:hypothetical protein
MAGWLKLQNEVAALIDSTAADQTDQTVSLLLLVCATGLGVDDGVALTLPR